MKFILATLLSVSCATVMAANTTSTTKATSNAALSKAAKGAYVGFSYINLTDIHSISEFEYQSSYSGTIKDKEYSESGTHLGMMGLSMGYEDTPSRGMGYSAGFQLFDSINPSEYGDQKVYFLVPDASLTAGLSSKFNFFVGLNLAQLVGQSDSDYIKPSLGAQAGFNVRFSPKIAWKNSYTMLHYTGEKSNSRSTFKADVIVSGYNSSLNYQF